MNIYITIGALICTTNNLYSVKGSADIKRKKEAPIRTAQGTNPKRIAETAAKSRSKLIDASIGGDTEKVATLLATGVYDINAVDNAGKSALIWAAQQDNAPVVALLLEAGAATDIQDKNTLTALMFAAEDGHAEVVDLLLNNGADVTIQDKINLTALQRATRAQQQKIIDLFDKHKKGVALFTAIKEDRIKDALALIDEGAALNLRPNNESRTILTLAVDKGNAHVVRALLNAGANINKKDKSSTALVRAVGENSLPMVKLLLEMGANPHIKTMIDPEFGFTAYQAAEGNYKKGKGNKEIVDLLKAATEETKKGAAATQA